MKKQIKQQKILSKANLTKTELLIVNYAVSVMLHSTKELLQEQLEKKIIDLKIIKELKSTIKNCNNVYQKIEFMMKEGDKNVNN